MIELQNMPALLERMLACAVKPSGGNGVYRMSELPDLGEEYDRIRGDIRETGRELFKQGGADAMSAYLDKLWDIDDRVIGILDKAWEGIGGWTP